MLSDAKEGLIKTEKTAYAPLPEPMTVRIRFRKVGNLQYISHLDFQRTFARVLVRAGIPMWYTQGFNPHAKITFALPLSVGAQSECEYIDLRIDRAMSPDEIQRRLNAELTEELCVLDAYVPTSGREFQDITFADYEIRVGGVPVSPELAAAVRDYLTTSPLMMEKKSKSGMRQVDITALIRALDASAEEDGSLLLRARLSASGAEYLNPDLLLRALREKFGALLYPDDPMHEQTSILRTHVYLADGITEFS